MADENIVVGVAAQAEEFKRLRARLRDAEKEIRTEFNKSVRAAISNLNEDVRQSAFQKLPKSGGFVAKFVTASQFTIAINQASIKFKMKNPYSLRKIDQGRLQHPVFGNRDRWVFQQVQPRFWTQPVEKKIPVIRSEVQKAMDIAGKRIEG